MLETVWEHGILFYMIGVMCIIGVISKLVVQTTLRRLVREAGKMNKSLHPLIKLVRAKFEHTCMISDKVQNVGAFVDKYIYEYRVLWIRLHGWRQMESIAIWGCVLLGGAGCGLAYIEQAPYEKIGQYAAAGIAGAVLLFALRMVTDENYQLEAAKNYMVDFLENTYARKYEKMNQKQDDEPIKEEAMEEVILEEEESENPLVEEVLFSEEEQEKTEQKTESENEIEPELVVLMKEEQKKEKEEKPEENNRNEEVIREILAEFLA
nr:hypothetical protein [uncultured Sellimonas sp.]